MSRVAGGEKFWQYTKAEKAADKQALAASEARREAFEQAVMVGTEDAYFALPDDVRKEFSILAFYRLVKKAK